MRLPQTIFASLLLLSAATAIPTAVPDEFNLPAGTLIDASNAEDAVSTNGKPKTKVGDIICEAEPLRNLNPEYSRETARTFCTYNQGPGVPRGNGFYSLDAAQNGIGYENENGAKQWPIKPDECQDWMNKIIDKCHGQGGGRLLTSSGYVEYTSRMVAGLFYNGKQYTGPVYNPGWGFGW